MSQRYSKGHLTALRRFAAIITLVTILGHLWLGFEQSYAQPLVALATAYSLQALLEVLEARNQQRRPRFLGGGVVGAIDFFLSAHITALATAMLLYFNDRLIVVAFVVAVAISSKTVFRVPVGDGKTRHFFNPSNLGITVAFLTIPWVGLAMPWHFTQNVYGALDWVIPSIIFCSGSYLNATGTKRIPLIAAWLATFVLQATVRHLAFGTSLAGGLAMMTGVPFVLFTFYMVPDPATTPTDPKKQILFGASVAVLYGFFMAMHIVYGLFYALTLVCAGRGILMAINARKPVRSASEIVSD